MVCPIELGGTTTLGGTQLLEAPQNPRLNRPNKAERPRLKRESNQYSALLTALEKFHSAVLIDEGGIQGG